MAAIKDILFGLVKTNLDANMKALRDYSGPLAQKNPKYFIEMCQAIGFGIAEGSSVIVLKTKDSGVGGIPPVAGIGAGVGVIVDRAWFEQQLYVELRQSVLDNFGRTLHDPWPPSKGNSGEFLRAIAKGISDGVTDHYATAYILTSAHPLVYMGIGLIKNGNYSGLVASAIEGLIISYGPSLKGKFWPILAKVVAKVYVDAIHNHSTGKVTIAGVCVVTPLPPQACGIPMSGVGTGTAV